MTRQRLKGDAITSPDLRQSNDRAAEGMMAEFDHLWIWQETGLCEPLGWYRAVAGNRMPAKFRIARQIPVAVPLSTAPEEALWAHLEERTELFLELWARIRGGEGRLPASAPQPNLLDLCHELSQRMLRHCNFCRWQCGVDRQKGTKFGTCKLAAGSRVSTYFHHMGEELVYRGTRGSGTIFFTSCNMRCAFCQNGDISTDKDNGQEVAPRTLATMAWLLGREGGHNINWVGGEVTIHLHTIIAAISLLADLEPTSAELRAARATKNDTFFDRFAHDDAGPFNVPQLWNSNFFMSPESMKLLRLLMDVWLPDFKFGPGRCSVLLAKTPWYWETVTENLKRIYDWGEDLTIRHLVMPNHVTCCTKPVLAWIAENLPGVPVNIMDQYHPDNVCDPRSPRFEKKYASLARRLAPDEIRQAFQVARELGINFEPISTEKRTVWQ